MRYLNCSVVSRRVLVTGVLLMLSATPSLALKPPDNVMPQTTPEPAEPPRETDKESLPADVSRSAPAKPASSERVRADSAVSFPVDI